MGLKREEGGGGEGFMIQKLKCGAASLRVSGCSTPPPTWRLEASSQHHGLHNNPVPEFLLHFPKTEVSARKLCACLWKILPHQNAPLARLRLRRHKSFSQPASARSVRRQVAASFSRHHRSIEPNHSNLPEAAQCNCEVTPTSSLESSCNVKTSRELLKVLNRIQSIREQHASNISVVKGMKVELDLSLAQIKELKREKHMKSLMKQMEEDKFVRKNNAHDRLEVAVQSVEEELEDEKRSRRLAQELSEVNSLFYGSLRELERERKARILLENLCDEFAIRIRDYEQESCLLKPKSEKNYDGRADRDKHDDRLTLDISEAWLHERIQMKVAKAGDDLVEINSVVDKLRFDVETFLRAKRSVNLRKYGNSSPKDIKEIHPHQYDSLDSFPLKESASAPVKLHEDDTARESQISTGKQVQSKQIKTRICHEDDDGRWFMERNSRDKTVLISEIEVSTVCEELAQVEQESDHRKSCLSTGRERVNSENMCRGDSCVHSVVGSDVSAVKQRKLKLSERVKEGTLKAKLLEARLDGHKFRSVALG